MSHIDTNEFGCEIPYRRIGVDYYKEVTFYDIWKSPKKTLVPWKKGEITQDHGGGVLNRIPKFDSSVIRPSNNDYQATIDGMYNWYSPFNHTPYSGEVTPDMIPNSLYVLNHVFGEQIEQGIKYMKLLYEYPERRTYVLCLVSKVRATGKTTFLNWVNMIFQDNFVMTNIETLEGPFNSGYVTKNIIAIDEAVSDKTQVVEKVKSLASGKRVPVNEKYVRGFQLDFFGKIIFCSNKEIDFLRVDKEEDRFWIRRLHLVPKKDYDANIEDKLKAEIPMFLKYLLQQTPLDLTKYRFILTPDEVFTEDLQKLKENSRPELYKDLTMFLEEFFNQNEAYSVCYASPIDIKNKFFAGDNRKSASYIQKVLNNDFEMLPSEKISRYTPFDEEISKTGKHYTFSRKTFTESKQDVLPF